MSFHDAPPFDMLSEQIAPYEGLGRILKRDEKTEQEFWAQAGVALNRLKEGFHLDTETPQSTARDIENAIAKMWKEGWDPEKGNINLFTRDFGLALTKAIIGLVGGDLVFRSCSDLSHLSVRWDLQKIEAFPFHKVYKRLLRRDGESVEHFLRGLDSILRKGDSNTT